MPIRGTISLTQKPFPGPSPSHTLRVICNFPFPIALTWEGSVEPSFMGPTRANNHSFRSVCGDDPERLTGGENGFV